jgi:very-short-patch-repair endonuclease
MRAPARTFARARRLRWTATEPERVLWGMLRGKQVGPRFRRQYSIGPYVLDFYCPAARLCVEVDGPVHLEPEQRQHDIARDAWLGAQGVRVLRFSAVAVMEAPAPVIAAIAQAATPSVACGDTSPVALPQGRTRLLV